MSISYSYKPVLIIAVLEHGGKITLDEAAAFFLQFYSQRLEKGLAAEKSNSIFSNLNCTYDQVIKNIKNNPVNALLNSSDCFHFNCDTNTLSIEPSLWNTMSEDQIICAKNICLETLERYYRSITLTEKSNITAFQQPQGTYGYLSNDYVTAFSVSGICYSSMAQFLTHRKLLSIGEEVLARDFLSIQVTDIQNGIIQKAKAVSNALWDGQKQVVAYKGLLAKFTQNDYLAESLLNTGSSLIAAYLPDDYVWGNGLDVLDKRVGMIDDWPGSNLLGFTLMQVRNALYSIRTF